MARPCHLRGRLRLRLLLSEVAVTVGFAKAEIEDLHVFFVAHSEWRGLFVCLLFGEVSSRESGKVQL